MLRSMQEHPVAPNSTDAAIARIRAFAAAQGWSRSRLANEAGIAATVLRHFGRPDWNPTADTLRKLEAPIPEGWQPGDPVAQGEAA